MSERPILSTRLVIGVLFLVLGVAWLADNLGLADVTDLLRWWPVILMAWGAALLTGTACERRPIAGAFWLLVGGLTLLHAFHLVRFSVWDLWPVMLIFAGGVIVLRAWRGGAGMGRAHEDADPHLSTFAMLGAATRKVVSDAFRGGDVTVVMGGAHIDLRSATFENGRAMLDVFAMWGGIEIVVAPGCRVVGEVTPLLGGFEDSSAAPVAPDAPTLVVRGLVLMGGVEVKHQPGGRGFVVDDGSESGTASVGYRAPGVFVGGLGSVRIKKEKGGIVKTVEVSPLGVKIRAERAGSEAPDASHAPGTPGPAGAAGEAPPPIEPE